MNVDWKRPGFWRGPAAVIISLALVACANEPPAIVTPANDLVWPSPPETARIQYLYAFSKPDDIGIRPGLFARIAGVFRGPEAKNIQKAYGLARDSEGRIYVVDNSYQAVHVFDTADNRYSRFPKRGIEGFVNPINVAIGSAGRIYVSDSGSGQVHVFTASGEKYDGTIGVDYFQRPTGLTVNHHTGELLVVDTAASRLLVFDEGDLSFKRVVGAQGSDAGEVPVFHYPTNVAVAGDGTVYVSDSLNFRIQVMDEKLELIGSFGAPGTAPGDFSRPKGVAVDSDGHVYVVDALFDNIQIFDEQGELLLAFGGPGSEPGRFWLPSAIFIDPEDRIYVSDSYNKRVQVFQYLKPTEKEE